MPKRLRNSFLGIERKKKQNLRDFKFTLTYYLSRTWVFPLFLLVFFETQKTKCLKQKFHSSRLHRAIKSFAFDWCACQRACLPACLVWVSLCFPFKNIFFSSSFCLQLPFSENQILHSADESLSSSSVETVKWIACVCVCVCAFCRDIRTVTRFKSHARAPTHWDDTLIQASVCSFVLNCDWSSGNT